MSSVLSSFRQIRHGAVGRRMPFVWAVVRPIWRVAARVATSGQGFHHLINGVDTFRLSLEQMHNGNPLEWEPDQYLEVMAEIKPGNHVLDIGAFWGLFTLGAAKRVGKSGRVVAIEPGPRQFRMLETNVRINKFEPTVSCIEEICAETAGTLIDFYADPEGSMVDSAVPNDKATIALSRTTTTIDDIVSHFKLTPNVIKIDVEGFEDLVLAGASKTLISYRPVLFVEFHPEELASRGQSTDTVLSLLDGYGYECPELTDASLNSVPRGHLFRFTSAKKLAA
ncbi:MAG TPA: FkbM family methyltransferase [Pyrinomonadaceae bacterium]|nr:FkbM family methyltransferase [Pyrinomonadaceae bacterium]